MKKRSLWGARFSLNKAWGPGLGIAMVLVGTVIGAGFASGAEIMAYFTRYGEAGFLGMLAAGLLIFLGTYGTLKIAYEYQDTDYGRFTERIAGKWAGAVLDAVVTLSMLLGYGVMLSGTGAIAEQQWGISKYPAMLAMAAACYLPLRRGSTGILAVCRVLTPILIIGGLLLGLYSVLGYARGQETAGLLLQPLSVFSALPLENWPQALFSGILYASYNILGAAAVLAGLAGEMRRREDIWRAAWIGTAVLVVLTLALGVATFLNYDTIQGVSIPALALLEEHAVWQQLYVGVLLGAMYTTAISDGFGVLNRVRGCGVNRNLLCLLLTGAAFLLAQLGFGDLVDKGYRLFGYLGIGQLILIAVHALAKDTIPNKGDIHEKKQWRRRKLRKS